MWGIKQHAEALFLQTNLWICVSMSGSKSKMVNCIALLTFKVLIAGTRVNRML